MKINHLILLSAAMLASSTGAFAQNIDTDTPRGYIAQQAVFKIADMYDFSRFNANLGTARSAAMAGAFTSLGADLSSMNINPAGLGMYRTSEFGITASLMATGIKNSTPGLGSTSASRVSVGLNNIGVAFNVYEGTGAVTSFTFGMNYNKLADFNYRSTVDIAQTQNSILDMFGPVVASYSNFAGVDALSSTTTPWREIDRGGAFMEQWGAILAYQTNLIQYNEAANNFFYAIDGDTQISHYLNTISKGSVGEYAFSGGWNFSNKFYFGFSLGVLDYYNNRQVTYSEDYTNNTAQDIPPALGMTYNQSMRTVGDGYNLKLGFIVRPTTQLRIGVAYHSPSIVTLKNTYSSDMQAQFSDGVDRAWPPTVGFTEKFYTPGRLLTGVSYILGEHAIIALDYEYTWYDGMRVRGDIYGEMKDWYKNEVKKYFTGAHTIRLGGEAQAADNLFVRAGASYVREGLVDDLRSGNTKLDVPIDKSTIAISAGLGYNFSASTSLNITYIYTATQNTLYYPYLYQPGQGGNPFQIGDAPFEINRTRHNLLLSLSHRF